MIRHVAIDTIHRGKPLLLSPSLTTTICNSCLHISKTPPSCLEHYSLQIDSNLHHGCWCYCAEGLTTPSAMHGTYTMHARHVHTELNLRRHGHLMTALHGHVACSTMKMYMSVRCICWSCERIWRAVDRWKGRVALAMANGDVDLDITWSQTFTSLSCLRCACDRTPLSSGGAWKKKLGGLD